VNFRREIKFFNYRWQVLGQLLAQCGRHRFFSGQRRAGHPSVGCRRFRPGLAHRHDFGAGLLSHPAVDVFPDLAARERTVVVEGQPWVNLEDLRAVIFAFHHIDEPDLGLDHQGRNRQGGTVRSGKRNQPFAHADAVGLDAGGQEIKIPGSRFRGNAVWIGRKAFGPVLLGHPQQDQAAPSVGKPHDGLNHLVCQDAAAGPGAVKGALRHVRLAQAFGDTLELPVKVQKGLALKMQVLGPAGFEKISDMLLGPGLARVRRKWKADLQGLFHGLPLSEMKKADWPARIFEPCRIRLRFENSAAFSLCILPEG
jgi:hypothetical protein